MKPSDPPGSPVSPRRDRILFLLLLFIALALRVAALSGRELWYDELQSITFSRLSIGDMLQSVIVFDPHPPLYYLQLHYWILVSSSETWTKLNSVFWSVLAVAGLYILCRRLVSARFAFSAGLVFAVLPIGIWYGQEVRMYSMIMALAIGSFYFAFEYLNFRRGAVESIGVFGFTAAFLYTHGSGFMLLISLAAYAALVWAKDRKIDRKIFFRFLLLLGIAASLYVLWMIKGLFFSMEQLQRPGLQEVIDSLAALVLGLLTYPVWLRWLAVVLVLAVAAYILLRDGEWTMRSIAISFFLLPIAVCLLFSYLIKPMWHYRTLIYTVPFLCMLIAWILFRFSAWLASRGLRAAWILHGTVGLLAVLLAGASLAQQQGFSYPWDMRGAAQYLQANTHRGDIVYIIHPRVFWGIDWYWLGPGSGFNPLGLEYFQTAPNGAYLLYPVDTEDVNPGATYWIVYRDVDSLDPISPDRLESIVAFDHLFVARLRMP